MNLGYIAGFLDGDGCIYRRNNRHGYLSLIWYNTHYEPIKRIYETLGCGVIHKDKDKRPNRKLIYRLTVYGKMAEEIYEMLNKFLVSEGGVVTWSYIAGFFDAEGYFHTVSPRKGWIFQLTNKNKTILDKIKDFTHVGKVYHRSNGNGLYDYRIYRALDIFEIVNHIKLEVIIKREQVDSFLDWIREPNRKLRRTHKLKSEIIRLYKKGFSCKQIGKRFNLDPMYIAF